MKKIITLLIFTSLSLGLHAQFMQKYFYSTGVEHLGLFAHLTNTFYQGSYDVQPGYVVVTINYTDVVAGNHVGTRLLVRRGSGVLFFTSIEVLYDNDFVQPFLAFGLSSALLAEIVRQSNPEDFNNVRRALSLLLNTDPQNWRGADWALFALNLDYASALSDN